MMEPHTKYLLALGAFRRSIHDFAEAAQALGVAAREYDPEGTAPDDPVVDVLFAEAEVKLRGAATLPGVYQLLHAALELKTLAAQRADKES